MPTSTYVALATTTLASASSSVTFSSIPASYRDLVLVCNAKTSGGNDFRIYFNSDTGSNYSYVRAYGTGSSTGSDAASGESGARTSAGNLSGDNSFVINIMDYSANDKHTTIVTRSNTSSVTMLACRWANTAAVNTMSLEVGGAQTFTSGSTFSLYGIEA